MSNNKTIYFPGLNGIRAIAALSVLLYHITYSLQEVGLNKFAFGETVFKTPRSYGLNGYGVSMFFTLSGFLITFLLIKEKETFSKVSIVNFYKRRILRIWPLYYFYGIIAVLFMLFALKMDIDVTQLVFYVFFSANIPFILGKGIGLISHYWSLGVEEQFYLFYPVFANSKLFSKWKLFFWFAFLFLLKLIFRVYSFKTSNNIPFQILHVTRFDCMALGGFGAFTFYENDFIYKYLKSKPIQVLAWMIFVFFSVFDSARLPFEFEIGHEIIAFMTLILILSQTDKTSCLVSLDNRLFDFMGRISFGLYVYHPLVMAALGLVLHFSEIHWYNYAIYYVLVLGCVTAVSQLSFNYLEKPFLKMKHTFAKVDSTM
jgi:peptidoglycan/LPS O-acetylase OafA/YrhL